MKYTYQHISASGTFDHFHIGHEYFLKEAYKHSKYVSIGISTDTFLKNKKYLSSVETFKQRKKRVETFLEKNDLLTRTMIFELNDVYGIARSDTSLEAVVVTKDTRKNIALINHYRTSNNLPAVEAIELPFMKSSDKKIISSTRIRAGEINRNGDKYRSLFDNKTLSLPISMRDQMRKPLGIVIKGGDNEHKKVAKEAKTVIHKMNPTVIITVGDIATESLKQQGLTSHIQVIDLKTKRKDLISTSSKKSDVSKIRNNAGSITKNAVKVFHKKLQEFLYSNDNQLLLIHGEEDLLALPAILLAPLGSIVIYGQFNEGLILVTVTSDIKDTVEEMIKHFE